MASETIKRRMDYQHGITETISVEAGSYTERVVTFPREFAGSPAVCISFYTSSTSGGFGNCTYAILSGSISRTGFTVRVYNSDSSTRAPRIYWIAIY